MRSIQGLEQIGGAGESQFVIFCALLACAAILCVLFDGVDAQEGCGCHERKGEVLCWTASQVPGSGRREHPTCTHTHALPYRVLTSTSGPATKRPQAATRKGWKAAETKRKKKARRIKLQLDSRRCCELPEWW